MTKKKVVALWLFHCMERETKYSLVGEGRGEMETLVLH